MRHRHDRARRGAALLEVIVALVILVSAGAATVALVGRVVHAVSMARAREDEIRAAGAFMDAVSLWSRDDFDRRLGNRAQGPWRLLVDRPSPSVYTVRLVDTSTAAIILETAVYRRVAREASRAP